ncbi:ATP-binding cassette domain-containing protein [Labrys neptuniae]
MTQTAFAYAQAPFASSPAPASQAIIEFRGIHKSFEGTGNAPVLQDINLAIAKGEIFCLMGTSGSGKSTLLRHVNRLISPSRGAISVHGRPVEDLDADALRELRSHQVGMVFQHFGLLPHRSALDNVLLPLELRGLPQAEAQALAAEQLDLVGLGHAHDKFPSQLSGGMQQRVGLARALVSQPDILLMDEPFSALDPTIRRDLQEQVRDLVRSRGITTIIVTHDPGEALILADRIALLREGRIVQVGTPDEILQAPADAWVEDFFRGYGPTRANLHPPLAEAVSAGGVGPAAAPVADWRQSRLVDLALGPARFAGGWWPLFWAGLAIEALAIGLLASAAASGWNGVAAPAAGAVLLAVSRASAFFGARHDRPGEVRRTQLSSLFLSLVIYGLVVLQASQGGYLARWFGPLSDRSVAVAVSAGLDQAIAWSQRHFQPGFALIVIAVRGAIESVEWLLTWLSWPVPVVALLFAAYQFAGRSVFVLTLAASAYLIIFGFWPQTVSTVALVGAALLLTVAIGIPAGILLARSKLALRLASPLLDIMQTLPSFVYLIPAVAFFSVGKTPAVIATVIFAIPPMIRLTTLGLQQVPGSAVEAAYAHGANAWQVLTKVELPLATPSILLGVNQAIVMSLSMVVVSALIGAGGLGYDVVTALRNIQGGAGFLAGIAIVFCAIVPDRIIQGAMQRRDRLGRRRPAAG